MGRPRVDLEYSKAAILWRLHKAIAEHEDLSSHLAAVCQEVRIPFNVGSLATDELAGDGFCQVSSEEVWEENPYTGDPYRENVTFVHITAAGVGRVDEWSDEYHDQLVRRIFDKRPPSEFEKLLSSADPIDSVDEIPASDRIVELDHNSSEYETAVRALEDFEQAALESNEFGELFAEPEDRVRVLGEIKAGISLLKSFRVKVNLARDLLLRTLKLVGEKLPEASIGALANRAADALFKILGMG